MTLDDTLTKNYKYVSGRLIYKVKKINGKTLYVHRLKMEIKLGRKLRRDEIVHHKNGNGIDNRLKNLKVVSFREHAIEHMKMGWKPVIGGVTTGSFKQGNLNPNAKITKAIVRKIRKEYTPYKVTTFSLAKKYGLSYSRIHAIAKKRGWAHVS